MSPMHIAARVLPAAGLLVLTTAALSVLPVQADGSAGAVIGVALLIYLLLLTTAPAPGRPR